MLRLGLLLSPVIALVLFRYPAVSMEPLPALAHLESSSLAEPGSVTAKMTVQILHREEGKRKIYRNGRLYDLPEEAKERKVFVPDRAQGYLLFERMGKEIEHRSHSGELFWQRESSAYPVASPDGDIILLITGDSNRVDVMDRNGILVEGSALSGSLLVDYSFAVPEERAETGASALVVFSDGHYYLLGPGGKLLYRDVFSKKPVFARSAGISPDGKTFAIHFDQDGKDHVQLFELDASEDGYSVSRSFDSELGNVHPYTVAMAVQGETVVLAPPGETISIRNGSVELDRLYEAGENPSLHKAMGSLGQVFLIQEKNRVLIIDDRGQLLGSFAMSALFSAGRFLPHGDRLLYHNLNAQFRLFQLTSESGSVE